MTSPLQPVTAVGVVVVDDSPVQRRFLRGLIDADPELTVIGEARTGKEAVALVERLHPAVVLMDLDLPVMNGIEAIERIMATHPTPILVYSAFVDGPDNANGLAALAAGAVDIVTKPVASESEQLASYAEALRRRLRVASRVRVITHPRGRLRSPTACESSAPAVAATGTSARQPLRTRPRTDGEPVIELVAIGVSTGGPQALSLLLGQLPTDFAPAVLVVQHMADGFLQGLADWLDSQCALPVRLGQAGTKLAPGSVTVAPGGQNLLVHDSLRVTTETPPPSQFHVPGIDPTFCSIASSVGAGAVGVILTGMGRDGAAGLKQMRDRGAITVGQDEASCAVYGMPGAAMAIGAVEYERPLAEIGPLLLELVASSRTSARGRG